MTKGERNEIVKSIVALINTINCIEKDNEMCDKLMQRCQAMIDIVTKQ